jgi:hypothetical protein
MRSDCRSVAARNGGQRLLHRRAEQGRTELLPTADRSGWHRRFLAKRNRCGMGRERSDSVGRQEDARRRAPAAEWQFLVGVRSGGDARREYALFARRGERIGGFSAKCNITDGQTGGPMSATTTNTSRSQHQ